MPKRWHDQQMVGRAPNHWSKYTTCLINLISQIALFELFQRPAFFIAFWKWLLRTRILVKKSYLKWCSWSTLDAKLYDINQKSSNFIKIYVAIKPFTKCNTDNPTMMILNW